MNGFLWLMMLYPRLPTRLMFRTISRRCVSAMMSLAKGGDNLSPPFLLRHQGEIKSSIVLILKVFSVLFSLFHPRRPNRLSAGWLGSVTNGFRKSKTQNLPQREQELYIRQKGIAMNGLKNGCAESLSVKN